ncbi:uncharacterized protein LOC122928531 isoform X3 [Bufo gargarizans]|uniref:uncharacterized protein LOC122928531 isoform X3 n=1 Tax=Bufo gargarizans TaxID=30331 RepID=UPI001CF1C09B|nr:uncharacterized protein LOC122928531 isoform X3 [Bufo gargarizans]
MDPRASGCRRSSPRVGSRGGDARVERRASRTGDLGLDTLALLEVGDDANMKTPQQAAARSQVMEGSPASAVGRRGPATRSGRDPCSEPNGVPGGVRRGPRRAASLGSSLDNLSQHTRKQDAVERPAAAQAAGEHMKGTVAGQAAGRTVGRDTRKAVEKVTRPEAEIYQCFALIWTFPSHQWTTGRYLIRHLFQLRYGGKSGRRDTVLLHKMNCLHLAPALLPRELSNVG